MGMIDETTRKIRLSQWAEMVRECKQSGMTVRAWCIENGMNEKAYFYRQRRVRRALAEIGESGLPVLQSGNFAKVPVARVTSSDRNPVTAINVNGIKVDIYENADVKNIKQSLKAVLELC